MYCILEFEVEFDRYFSSELNFDADLTTKQFHRNYVSCFMFSKIFPRPAAAARAKNISSAAPDAGGKFGPRETGPAQDHGV